MAKSWFGYIQVQKQLEVKVNGFLRVKPLNHYCLHLFGHQYKSGEKNSVSVWTWGQTELMSLPEVVWTALGTKTTWLGLGKDHGFG